MNSGARPEFLDGVFHPNINGMNAYRNAIIEEYNNYSSRTATRPKGKALSIGLMTIVNFHQGGLSVDSLWHFCLTKYGHAVECDEKSDLVKEIQSQGSSDTEVVVDTEQLPWPGSTYRLDIEGRKCDYRVMAVMPGDYFARTTSEIHGGSSEE